MARMMKWEGYWWCTWRYNSSICWDGSEKNHENLVQGIRSLCQKLNIGLSTYYARVVTTTLWHSVNNMW
jgi:hypothetical protein